jgi:large subunit ribosomal protein L29
MNKAAEKLRNMSLNELRAQERDQMDQLFRLKFQMKMGQTESLNKIRSLRRSVARIKTTIRQQQLGLVNVGAPKPAASEKTELKPAKSRKTAEKAGKR